jgi:hypothetical protein
MSFSLGYSARNEQREPRLFSLKQQKFILTQNVTFTSVLQVSACT